MEKIKKLSARLFSMRTALFILSLLILACVAGSVIPQGESEAVYMDAYPGALGHFILLMELDNVFHCWWFVVLTAFLCLNLLGCNLLRFPALIRQTKDGFTPQRRLDAWDGTPEAVLDREPEALFRAMGFRRIQTVSGGGREARYAARHRAGIWGAWLTHLGMLIIIVGFALGQLASVQYTVYGVPGQTKQVGETAYALTIDDFQVALRPDDTVEQYTARLTLIDTASGVSRSGEVSVNHPLSLFGMKLYQNSTGWAARVWLWRGEELLQEEILCAGEVLPVKEPEGLALAFNAFYPDYTVGPNGMPATASSRLEDPAYLYTLTYRDAILGMNVLRQGQVITVEDYTLSFSEPQSYTLIQLKRDPFTWLAALGGGIMMLALVLSFYVRPEELWAVCREDGSWAFAGYSRKGSVLFHEALQEKAKPFQTQST